jgi:PleD family two-component response regulator
MWTEPKRHDRQKSWRMKMAEEFKASLKALRVLVMEDNAFIGMLYADLLEDMGHAVCAIEATATGAVAAAAPYKPDLMIVDAALGEGSGVSAVKESCALGSFHMYLSVATPRRCGR